MKFLVIFATILIFARAFAFSKDGRYLFGKDAEVPNEGPANVLNAIRDFAPIKLFTDAFRNLIQNMSDLISSRAKYT